MPKHNEIFVERHENGYAVLRPNAERASAVTQTQAEAIDRERLRTTQRFWWNGSGSPVLESRISGASPSRKHQSPAESV